jgi:transposase-like protein
VPHKSYSILFILHVLKAYFFREETVAALCLRYGIGVATLYAWKKQYWSSNIIVTITNSREWE